MAFETALLALETDHDYMKGPVYWDYDYKRLFLCLWLRKVKNCQGQREDLSQDTQEGSW